MKRSTPTRLAVFTLILVFPVLGFSQTREVKSRVKPRDDQDSVGQRQPTPAASGQLPQTRKLKPRGSVDSPRRPEGNNVGQALPAQRRPAGLRQILPGQPKWELGVTFVPAPLGVRVTSVQFGSPASRSLGLERDDYILDINATPIGEVAGDFYPFSEVLNQWANNPLDPGDHGWVNVTIWNHRTGRVDNPDGFWVKLRQRN